MSITSAIVLYAVCWFLTFLVVIPFRLKTQADVGEVVPGTHSASPEVHNLRQKAWLTTGIAAALWGLLAFLILSDWVTIDAVRAFMQQHAGMPS